MADQDLEHILRRMAQAKVNRRGFMAGGAMAGMAAFIAACTGAKVTDAPPASVAAVPSTAPTAAAPSEVAAGPSATPVFSQEPTEGHLWMYNWSDYVDAGNIEEYKKRYAVDDFTYDIYPSNEELVTKLQAGATGQYDIGAPTAEFVPALVKGGFIQKIDWSKVPNAKYIDKQFKGLWWDPNDEYQLPKDWGTTGIAVRSKYVKEDVSSWKNFFDVAPKYHGKIVIVDSPGDVFVAPLKALGYSLNSVDPNELSQARDLLLQLAPHVLALDSDQYQKKLQTGEAVLGLTWTGGLDELIQDPKTADTKYIIPSDGTLYWLDTWVIFANPPHPIAAHAFLNFIEEPDIQAQETITNAYATPNDEAKKLIPQKILDDPTIFVPQAIFDSGLLESAKDVSTDKLRVDIWAEFKSKIGKA
jgi:spermidine/putrescine transport system substrate-binding protein